jgi:hypothetical protein
MPGKGKDYGSFHTLCECGSIVQRNCIIRHQTTKKHNELMKEKEKKEENFKKWIKSYRDEFY